MGSLKLPVTKETCSAMSIQSFSSQALGLRMGWGGAQMSRPPSRTSGTRSSSSG